MTKYPNLLISILFFFFTTYTFGQTTALTDYEGQWIGTIDQPNAFHFKLSMKVLSDKQYNFKLSNHQDLIHQDGQFSEDGSFSISLGNNSSFSGNFNEEKSEITGFVKSGLFLFHVLLQKDQDDFYSGYWNIFMIERLSPTTIYFVVEDVDGEQCQAYPVFADQRFRGTWAANHKKKDNLLTFTDFMGGLDFKAELLEDKIQLKFILGESVVASVPFKKMEGGWTLGNDNKPNRNYVKPLLQNDGWKVTDLKDAGINPSQLNRMNDSIYANALTHVHAVVIAKNGEIAYEKYFSEFSSNTPHDQRSANKSITSAIVGIAIDEKRIESVNQSIYEFIPKEYQYTKTKEKAAIDLKSLLTMSSGIDAIDFGIKRNSVAAEDNYQPTQDWAKTVLEAPMIGKPNEHANYGSANPFLLGYALDAVVEQPLENYMDEKLFSPLGITNYVLNTDITGKPYFAGGMYITPRDMLKFGELYRNNGSWNGKQIVSKGWVKTSTKNYLVLENTDDKNGYGYLWWHETYEVNGKKVKSFEARGAGGQVIFVMPELDVVTVITSGNYRNGRYWQPQMIMREYVLPALIN